MDCDNKGIVMTFRPLMVALSLRLNGLLALELHRSLMKCQSPVAERGTFGWRSGKKTCEVRRVLEKSGPKRVPKANSEVNLIIICSISILPTILMFSVDLCTVTLLYECKYLCRGLENRGFSYLEIVILTSFSAYVSKNTVVVLPLKDPKIKRKTPIKTFQKPEMLLKMPRNPENVKYNKIIKAHTKSKRSYATVKCPRAHVDGMEIFDLQTQAPNGRQLFFGNFTALDYMIQILDH
ncbi:hypothetical protein E5288_WYG011575 [Bos mutus]|uniref:Uncharacterized protein n=1 Tax=Bos mutus TaxID=72004 RepID=A0A6B0RHY3_9CETA|nr:hypothetical protein [Bos mutus]